MTSEEVIRGMAAAIYNRNALHWQKRFSDLPEWKRDKMAEAARAAIRWLQANGFRIVPAELTTEMAHECREAVVADCMPVEIYRAVLTAAPEIVP